MQYILVLRDFILRSLNINDNELIVKGLSPYGLRMGGNEMLKYHEGRDFCLANYTAFRGSYAL